MDAELSIDIVGRPVCNTTVQGVVNIVLSAIQISRGPDMPTQLLTIGDFCAFRTVKEDPQQHSQAPYPKNTFYWKVGRVLALHKIIQNQKAQFSATVQWFPHFNSKYTKKTVGASDSYKGEAKLFRHSQAIVESSQVETVVLEDFLLPVMIHIKERTFFKALSLKGIDVQPEEVDPGSGCFTAFYHCRTRIEGSGLCKLNPSEYQHGTISTVSLERGWQQLPTIPKGTLEQAYTNLGPVLEQARFASAALNQLEKDEKEESVATEQEKEDIAPPAKKQRSSNVKQTKRKAKQKPAPKSKKIVPKKKTAVSKKRSTSTHKAPPKQTKRRKTEDAETASLSDSSAASVELIDFDPQIRPLSEKPIYVPRGRTTKDKRQFYNGVKLSLPLFCNEFATSKKIAQRWTLQVGDLIAVATDDVSPPPGPPIRPKKSEWYPYLQAWGPAQVLSIFQQGQSSEYHMELRWLYRPDDIVSEGINDLELDDAQIKELFDSPHSNRMVVETDEMVETCPVGAALGRITITSDANPTQKWLKTFLDDEGVPQLPLICRYLYNSRQMATSLNAISDWIGYRTTFSGPLGRGLVCEKAFPGKKSHRKLQKAYVEDLRERFRISDELIDKLEEGSADEESMKTFVRTSWPEALLQGSVNVDNRCSILFVENTQSDESREFLDAINLAVVSRRCDARATAKKSNGFSQTWRLRIGDIVCIARNGALPPKGDKNPWQPFIAPWSVGQVTCIYREKRDGKTPQALLEVRWFRRRVDFSPQIQRWMPPLTEQIREQEEFFESDEFERDIPASHVLGRTELFLGHNQATSQGSRDNQVPSVKCRCRYLFLSGAEQFQPLYFASSVSSTWFNGLQERGFKLSGMIHERRKLAESLQFHLSCSILGEHQSSGSLFSSILDSVSDNQISNRPAFTQTQEGSPIHYYLSIAIIPRWNEYNSSEHLFARKDRSNVSWTIRAGDIVAVECSASTAVNDRRLLPFTTPWRAAQVISIFSQIPSRETDTVSLYEIEVRWLYRDCELNKDSIPNHGFAFGKIYESSGEQAVETLPSNRLLGPLALISGGSESLKQGELIQMWESVPKSLPVAPHVYSGEYDIEAESSIGLPSKNRKRFATLIERGLNLSSRYQPGNKANITSLIKEEYVGADLVHGFQPHFQLFLQETESPPVSTPSSLQSTQRTEASSNDRLYWFSDAPFHIDHGTSTEFYTSLNLTPPHDAVDPEIPNADIRDGLNWIVRIGDVVTLRCDTCTGSTPWGVAEGIKNTSTRFPFRRGVNWGVGELVTIRKQRDDVSLEIRWFYRADELHGVGRAGMQRTEGYELEEIYESDHYDHVSPLNLLAPVRLHEQQVPVDGPMHVGLPITQYLCKRFWSIHRKSLIPTGGLNGRLERSRSKSKYLRPGSIARAAVESSAAPSIQGTTTPAASSFRSITAWQDAFKTVIQKLSLTDASKEAFLEGGRLIGRENEQKQLRSFLRGAITGKLREGSKACLFVAGPPGTGKTASIRVAVNELQREQTAGKIPGFDFIGLNGMEMRDPFEAYVKLWEELSQDRSKCSPEAAARKLDSYFSRGSKSVDGGDGRIIVVLLDEIDYLVTKQQSVLYNFFDWPASAAEGNSNRRLIVIGISNTLNLRDRLHPRVQSRIDSNSIFFKAYNELETSAILTEKLRQASPSYTVFQEDAIRLASKKTASVSGDIRKAFYICRRAAEMVLDRNVNLSEKASDAPIVRIKDVFESSKESQNAAESRFVAHCTTYEVLLLVALGALRKTTGRESGGFDVEELLAKMKSMATTFETNEYQPHPSLPEALGMLSRLGEAHLVTLETPRDASISYRSSLAGSGGPWPLVSVVLDDTALLMALKATEHSKLARKHLATSGLF